MFKSVKNKSICEAVYKRMLNVLNFNLYFDKDFYNYINEFKSDLINLEKKNKTEEILEKWHNYFENLAGKISNIKNDKKTLPYIRADRYKISQLQKNIEFALKIKGRNRVYFTLDDIIFKEDYFLIKSYDIIKIPCIGCLPLHNELRPELSSLVGDNLYKIIVNSDFEPDFSFCTDYKIITSLFEKRNSVSNDIHLVDRVPGNLSSNLRIRDVTIYSELGSKNIYLKLLYTKLRSLDKVFTINEANNDLEEKTLLFKFYRNNKVCFIWENENINRASYFFSINEKKAKLLLEEIVKLISSIIVNKRDKLINIDEALVYIEKSIGPFNRKRIIHTTIYSYENEYFKLINTY